MKSKYAARLIITIIGAAVGMTLSYLFSGSLATGALLGSLMGFYFSLAGIAGRSGAG